MAVAFLITLPWLNPFATGPSPATVQWLLSLGCAAMCFMIALCFSRSRLGGTVAMAWLAAAVISGLMGLLQYFGAAYAFVPWVNNAGMGEAFANLRQRNQFATLTNIGFAALLWWSARLGSEQHLQPHSPLNLRDGVRGQAGSATTVLLAVANAASSSRTGLVQLVMLIALAAWWGGLRRREVRGPLLVAALAYAVASALLPLLAGLDPSSTGILARFHDGGAACSSRLTLWSNVLHLISLKPWLGWGWGELDFAHFTTLYAGPRFCEILDNAHNLPLHLAVELGVPAALLICSGGLWLVWRAKPWRERDATRQMAWSALALIMLHSMLEYPLWYGPFQMAFGLCIGLLWQRPSASAVGLAPAQATSAATSAKIPSNKPLALALCAGSATIIIVFAAFAAWDYHRVSQIYLPPEDRSPAYRSNTLAKIQGSWLFQNQVRFAELTTTSLTPDNAPRLNAMAHDLLHFSPEARVVEKAIDSARLLGRAGEAQYFEARYLAAFPQEHAEWAKANAARR